jgi:hypothetical protein
LKNGVVESGGKTTKEIFGFGVKKDFELGDEL